MSVVITKSEFIDIERMMKKSSLISTILSIIVALLSTCGIGFGFYYQTKASLEQHDRELIELKQDVEATRMKVDELSIYRGVSSAEMENLENKVDKIDVKLDKILNKIR
tara:strand:+ start:1261 stop:1587 length:327 start_codon:yes stop_codon:yes gene_type:complete